MHTWRVGDKSSLVFNGSSSHQTDHSSGRSLPYLPFCAGVHRLDDNVSTLLYCISGMDAISSGSVQFNGVELSSLSEEQLSKIRLNSMGFIFQHIFLLKSLSIIDNIMLSAHLAKIESPSQIERKAHALMCRMNIAALADHDITQASGGELQRVSICRALMNSPDILFGDEPTEP